MIVCRRQTYFPMHLTSGVKTKELGKGRVQLDRLISLARLQAKARSHDGTAPTRYCRHRCCLHFHGSRTSADPEARPGPSCAAQRSVCGTTSSFSQRSRRISSPPSVLSWTLGCANGHTATELKLGATLHLIVAYTHAMCPYCARPRRWQSSPRARGPCLISPARACARACSLRNRNPLVCCSLFFFSTRLLGSLNILLIVALRACLSTQLAAFIDRVDGPQRLGRPRGGR